MGGFVRLARKFADAAMLAVLALQGCAASGTPRAQDAAGESAPDAVVAVAPDPADASVTAADAEPIHDVLGLSVVDSPYVADRGYAADRAYDESWDVESDTVSMVPVTKGNILFSDTFEDGRPDGWASADPGAAGTDTDWSIVFSESGPVYCQGSLDNRAWHISHAEVPPREDQIVQAIVRADDFYTSTTQSMVAVFARYDAASDSGYLLALRGDGSAILRKRISGVTASWDAGIDLGIVPGRWYTVHVEAVGSTVTAFVDGKLILTVRDPWPITSGTIAFGTYGATLEIQGAALAHP